MTAPPRPYRAECFQGEDGFLDLLPLLAELTKDLRPFELLVSHSMRVYNVAESPPNKVQPNEGRGFESERRG